MTTFPPTPVPLPRRLLGVWAHPDDEAYLSAGLMARVVDAGGSVTVLTATRGELGRDDPDPSTQVAFAAQRQRELEASLAQLGVGDLRFLDLADGACAAADGATIVTRLLDTVAEVRPDVVVTFGPDGITGHSDHRAVCGWTTDAWVRHGGFELLYATMSDDHLARHADLHAELGLFDDFADGRAFSVPAEEMALTCALDEAELTRKRAALARHASQTEGLAAMMGEATYRTWWRDETFRRPTAAERRVVPTSARCLGARR